MDHDKRRTEISRPAGKARNQRRRDVRQLDAWEDEEGEILPLLANQGEKTLEHVFQVRGVSVIRDGDRSVPSDRRPARVLAREKGPVGVERVSVKVDPKR